MPFTVVDSIRYWFYGKCTLSGDRWKAFRKESRRKGVRIDIHDNGKIFVQCSLPRHHFGHNGRLLISQREIDEAWAALCAWVNQGVSATSRPVFTQIDLCWHLPLDPSFFIGSLAGCPHPQIHGYPGVWPGESITWGRPNSVMHIKGYDKEKQLNHRPGKVVRIEVSLRGYALTRELNHGHLVDALLFQPCYEAFRRILVQFNPKPKAQLTPGSNYNKRFVAAMDLDGLARNGRLPSETYLAHYKSKQSAKRVARELRSIKLEMGAVNFELLLPQLSPPAPLSISPRKRRRNR